MPSSARPNRRRNQTPTSNRGTKSEESPPPPQPVFTTHNTGVPDPAPSPPEVRTDIFIDAESRRAFLRNLTFPTFDPLRIEEYKSGVHLYLQMYNFTIFITHPNPAAPEAPGLRETAEWKTMSAHVYRLLMGSLGDAHSTYSIGSTLNDALSLWDAIMARAAPDQKVRLTGAVEAFTALTMKTGEALEIFLARFDKLRLECDRLGLDFSDFFVRTRLYSALPEAFRHRLDGAGRDLSYIESIDVLREYDQHRTNATATPATATSTALAVFKGQGRECPAEGHRAEESTTTGTHGADSMSSSSPPVPDGTQKKPKPFHGNCHYCGIKGHRDRDCRKKKREAGGAAADKPVTVAMLTQALASHGITAPPPPPAPAAPLGVYGALPLHPSSGQSTVLMVSQAALNGTTCDADLETLDGGSEDSIYVDRSRFENYKTGTDHTPIELVGFQGARSGVFSVGHGDVTIYLTSESTSPVVTPVTLRNVLHVPAGVAFNIIISENSVTEAGIAVTKCPRRGANLRAGHDCGPIIAHLPRAGGRKLYRVPTVPPPTAAPTRVASVACSPGPVSPAGLHAQGGHVPLALPRPVLRDDSWGTVNIAAAAAAPATVAPAAAAPAPVASVAPPPAHAGACVASSLPALLTAMLGVLEAGGLAPPLPPAVPPSPPHPPGAGSEASCPTPPDPAVDVRAVGSEAPVAPGLEAPPVAPAPSPVTNLAAGRRLCATTSQSGVVRPFCAAPVSFFSRTQLLAPSSPADTELQAVAVVVRVALWMRALLAAFGPPQEAPTTVYGDNRPAIPLASSPPGGNKT